ncbi:hypothetical protein [Microcystis aeruginosa]|nr:hypothetical protein [Microcystis aeruginosa]CCI05822.1 hypothetical protein MICAD_1350008 [Microcystis aeruginosa PCC 7941]
MPLQQLDLLEEYRSDRHNLIEKNLSTLFRLVPDWCVREKESLALVP